MYPLLFFFPKILKFQVWRLVTSFLITGRDFQIIMDPYFFYTYASQLETGSVRFSQPGDFFFYIVFVGAFILVSFIIILSSTRLVLPFPFYKNKKSLIDPRKSARPVYTS